MLSYPNGTSFVSSRTPYLDTFIGFPGSRIYIPVKFESLPKTMALVDTGAPWCILSREEATVLDPEYKENALNEVNLGIRGFETQGVLVRWHVTIFAEEGFDLTIDGTIFVPDHDLDIPNFIGLDGLLSRIRFAVDPQENYFFFGSI